MKRLILHFVIITNSIALMAQDKSFNRANSKANWQYVYPFEDKNYVFAIAYQLDTNENHSQYANVYYGKRTSELDRIYWKEKLLLRPIKDNISYDDFDGDGIKDLLIFGNTGARGSNSCYFLYLLKPKSHSVEKVNGFNKIVNPSYHKELQVIVGNSFVGEDNYISVYRIDPHQTIYQIGEAFKETDEMDVNVEIEKLLKKHDK